MAPLKEISLQALRLDLERSLRLDLADRKADIKRMVGQCVTECIEQDQRLAHWKAQMQLLRDFLSDLEFCNVAAGSSTRPASSLVFSAGGRAYLSGVQPEMEASSFLGGKNADGSWRTMQAKAYPAELCRVIAAEYIAFYQKTSVEGFDPLPDALCRNGTHTWPTLA